jgi:dUTPase
MFGDHFYHATMRKSVAVFGTLFNNLKVARTAADGSILNQIRVPLAYGPKQKFLARLDQETGFDAQMAIKLPRMAFEISGVTLDTTQKLAKRNIISETHASDVTKKKTIKHYTSYDIGMSLYIMAKNQDDGLQIVEQILPYFSPEYNVTITPVSGFNHKQDVAIILGGVTIDDQYEGDFVERRVLIYQLDFTMKMKFYGPTGDQGIIREVNIDFHDKDVTTALFEEMDFTVGASDDADDYTVTTTITQDGTE